MSFRLHMLSWLTLTSLFTAAIAPALPEAAEVPESTIPRRLELLKPHLQTSAEAWSNHLLVDGIATGTVAASFAGLGVWGISEGTVYGTIIGSVLVLEGIAIGGLSLATFMIRGSDRNHYRSISGMPETSPEEQREKLEASEELLTRLSKKGFALRLIEGAVFTLVAASALVNWEEPNGYLVIPGVIGAFGIYQLFVPSTPERELDQYVESRKNLFRPAARAPRYELRPDLGLALDSRGTPRLQALVTLRF